MKLYTIGFTKKSAEDFFELLSASGASASRGHPPQERVAARRIRQA